jgi:uncharacterized protein (TIGR01319 family)
MAAALLIDFGSTYTKACAVDLDEGRILGRAQAPSTVDSDVTIGLKAVLADLDRHTGGLPEFRHRLASSSAAGGLRMVTVGLVRELTAEAARQAALGAGAKLVGTFAYELTEGDAASIAELAPDIVLLSGGTDGGNSAVIVHNAEALAGGPLACPIIVAGNRSATERVSAILEGAGKAVLVAENVMPEFHKLNIEPARKAIRQVFLDRIIQAKGIDRAADFLDGILMPTPAAVLAGARLLSEGHGDASGLGPLVVVDVGGATTDVHSVCDGMPGGSGVVFLGLPEPYVKRTVEGDLGMRINAASIDDTVGRDALAADGGVSAGRIGELLDRGVRDVEWLPGNDDEFAFDQALARAAVKLSVSRHAGTVSTAYTATGPVNVQHGKDLGEVATLIGTGGVLVGGRQPRTILDAALADDADPFSLRPRAPELMLDGEYILYACGLLGEVEPAAALALGLRHIHPLNEGEGDDRSAA